MVLQLFDGFLDEEGVNHLQPEFRGASQMPFYGILWHIVARCEAIWGRSAS